MILKNYDTTYGVYGRPRFGSLVVLDANKNLQFLDHEDYDDSKLPTGWTKVGVVSEMRGGNPVVDAMTDQSYKMMDAFLFAVTGYVLDGATHSIAMRNYWESSTATSLGNFDYSATTDEQFCQQLDAWLKAHEQGNEWHAKIMPDYQGVDRVHIILDEFTQWYHSSSPIASGATATASHMNAIPAYSNTPCAGYQNGTQRAFASGCPWPNKYSAKAYGMASGSATAVTSQWQNGYPIKPVAFDASANLVANFGDYDGFITGHDTLLDVYRGAASVREEDIVKWCDMLGDVTVPTIDGGSKLLYPALNYIKHYSLDHPMIAAGKWGLWSVRHAISVYRDVRYTTNTTWKNLVSELSNNRNCDVLNSVRNKFKATAVSLNASRWLLPRYGTSYGWIWGGSNGTFYCNGYFSYRYLVGASALLNLTNLNK